VDEKMWAEPCCRFLALASNVLAVCVPGEVGDWAAYIGTVPGMCHDQEWQEVARHGEKLPRKIAQATFPRFDPAKYRD